MDWSSVLGVAISGVFSLAICVITQATSNKATRELLEYRLTQLEAKVDKHNNLVERVYDLEKKVALLEAEE